MAALLAWLWKLKVERAGGHIQLFSNCEVEGSQGMVVAQDWFKVAAARGSICVWDEAHRSFDSRKHASFQNILATDILTFVRKMVSIQIFATPSVTRLDTRIRELLEVLLVVRNTGAGINIDFYDFQADYAGKYGQYICTRFIPRYKLKQIYTLNLFDTNAFVRGFPLPKTEREADPFMAELERIHNESRLQGKIERIQEKATKTKERGFDNARDVVLS